jgi:hypothetical protein
MLVARDNLGLWLIDCNNFNCYCLTNDLQEIKTNLFGHGSIIEIEEDRSKSN